MLGEDGLSKLRRAAVLICGLGGVGGYVCEALARAGIGTLVLADCDVVEESNFNRQILATDETLGMKKTEAARRRILSINKDTEVIKKDVLITKENVSSLFDREVDFVCDAIDDVSAKTAVILEAQSRNIPVISCMGTGNKTDPAMMKISDISKTETCPLARAMRHALKQAGVTHCPVVWSGEIPCGGTEKSGMRNLPGSMAPVPGAAGLIMAGYVIKEIINKK